jgi:hypothetical protein
MTTPTGAIKFSDIAAEFGTPPGKNLGAYRTSQTIDGDVYPLDTGVPSSSSSAISFGQLRGKTLNVIVDTGTGADISDGLILTDKTKNTWYSVGYQNLSNLNLSQIGPKKYYFYIRKSIGDSSKTGNSALSGSWPSGSSLNVFITNNSYVQGFGGAGGDGALYGNASGPFNWSGTNGGNGGNAFGFSYSANVTIKSGGVFCGFGGGGGGGYTYSNPDTGPFDPTAGGGGGGGGQGNPGGTGGHTMTGYVGGINYPQFGTAGSDGSKTSGGNGGQPGCNGGPNQGANNVGGGGGGGGGNPAGSSNGCRGTSTWGIGANGTINGGGEGARGDSLGGTGGGNGLGIYGVRTNNDPTLTVNVTVSAGSLFPNSVTYV